MALADGHQLKNLREAIIKEPINLELWLRYLNRRQDASFDVRRAIFERSLHHLPGSYKMWAQFLIEFTRNVRGKHVEDGVEVAKRIHECRLAFDRALVYLGKMPRIWIMYAEFLIGHGFVTHSRQALDRSLRALPVTQHDRIWKIYIPFVEDHPDLWQLGMHVFPRYLQFNPGDKERYVDYLLAARKPEIAMQVLQEILDDKSFVSAKGLTLHQIWMKLCDLIVENAREAHALGRNTLDVDAILRRGLAKFTDETGRLWCGLAEYYIKLGMFHLAENIYEEGLKMVATVRDFSAIFDAYAAYYEGTIDAKLDIFDKTSDDSKLNENDLAVKSAKEIKRFDPLFFDVNVNAEEKINDVDLRLASMERLFEQRPLMLSSVVLRQNPNNVGEWHNRASLFIKSDDLVSAIRTYSEAVEKVSPILETNGTLDTLWSAFAKIYENNEELDEARAVYREAFQRPYKTVDHLVNLYCCAVEMELRNECFSEALELVRTALTPVSLKKFSQDKLNDNSEETGRSLNVNLSSSTSLEAETAGAKEMLRMRKSLYHSTRLWSLYADLEESLGSLKSARAVYWKMIELKVATPLTILNFAGLLEENKYFEDTFKIYEKGITLFPWPHVGDIWFCYLRKFIDRYKGEKLFRARDLFEDALAGVPRDKCLPFFLLLFRMEEQYGDARRALGALDRLCDTVPESDCLRCFLLYIGKAEEYFGISRARQIYELAVKKMDDPSQIRQLCEHYAEKERRLGEIDRARAIYQYAATYANPAVAVGFWSKWREFEVAHGNEETLRLMLRVKKTVKTRYSQSIYSLGGQGAVESNASSPGFVSSREKETYSSVSDDQSSMNAENISA